MMRSEELHHAIEGGWLVDEILTLGYVLVWD